jgi:hypothetical protein
MSKVIVVEPQCTGFEHVEFNAALLATIQYGLAFPPLELWSERVHAEMVGHRLAQHVGSVVSCRELGVAWSSVGWFRLQQEIAFCKKLLDRARSTGTRLVVFASASGLSLIALKHCLRDMSDRITVLAFVHSALGELARSPRRPWNRPLSIKTALRLTCPPQLKLIALSAAGAAATRESCPGVSIYSLDHPYLFRPKTLPGSRSGKDHRRIRIGVPGAVRTRLGDLASLISTVRKRTGNVDFEIVGHVPANIAGRRELIRLLPDVPDTPIGYDTYRSRLSALDYVLLLPDRVQHRFAASCTLLDAFDHCKPGLFLTSPLLDEYRSTVGEFGIFHSGTDQIASAILEIAARFPAEQYREQEEAMRAGRLRFNPSRVAPALKRILET